MLLLTLLSGCEEKQRQRLDTDLSSSRQSTVRALPCRLLIVGESGFSENLQRQWSARNDSPLTIDRLSRAELAERDFQIDPEVDVAIYPSDLMIELISRRSIEELPAAVYESDTFDKRSLLTHYRKSGIRYDSKTWAVPCGGPMLVQLTRPQVLEEADLNPPGDWPQLVRIAQRLTESADAQASDSGSIGRRVSVPLAAGSAAHVFLAASASTARQPGRLSTVFERRTMRPLIATAPFIAALDHLKALAMANANCINMNQADVYFSVLAGESAIGITSPGQGFDASPAPQEQTRSESTGSESTGSISCSMVPGADEFFDAEASRWIQHSADGPLTVNYHGMPGWLASETAGSRRHRAAEQFLLWIGEPMIGELVFSKQPGSGPVRHGQLDRIEHWLPGTKATGGPAAEGTGGGNGLAMQYADTLRAASEQPLILTFPTIRRQAEYIRLLDEGVRACIEEEKDSEESLKQIVSQWDALTEQIGRQKQIELLRRSSNF